MTETLITPPATSAGDPANTQLLAQLWRRRSILLWGAVLGGILGVTVALLRPTYFTATATLLFPASPVSRLPMLTGVGGGDLPSMPLLEGALMVPQPGSSAATAALLVQSRRAQQTVITALDLQRHWDEKSLSDTHEHFTRDLINKPGRNGELYVGFRDTSPARAQRIAQTLVDELGRLSATLGIDPAQAGTDFLRAQLTQAQGELTRTQNRLLAFQERHQIVDLPEQARELAAQYAQLESDLIRAELDATVAQRQARELTAHAQRLIKACVDPVPGPSDKLGPLYTRVVSLESELTLLKDTHAPDHPTVQEQGRKLAQARQVLSAEILRQSRLVDTGSTPGVNQVVIQAAVAQARATGVRQAKATLQQRLRLLPQQQADYAQLQALLTGQVTKVQFLQQELTKAEIITQSRGPLFVVLDPAERPLKPDSAGRTFLVLLGIFLGVGAASLVPYIEWYRQQLRQPQVDA
jgi:uncharacterized protein involved in exopolysaccharide biosynthesis